jgi:thiosulfate dehydrogenase [quinone] large subunit
MLNRSARYILAAIQAIVGWEWLMSGGNKLLSGTFPQGLATALNNGIKGNPNGWYVGFLQQVVLPHSALFGYLIEWSEITVGIIMLGGALVLLGKPRMPGEAQHRFYTGYSVAVIIAAIVAIFQNVNFHFFMGGWVIPTFDPTRPYNEGIDLDGLLPLFFLTIIIANFSLLKALTGAKTVRSMLRLSRSRPQQIESNAA